MLDPLPPELALGMDYVAYALDPDGHCIQLYYYMEQIGWDGRSRPQSQRRQATGEWPELWSRCPIRTRTRCIRDRLGDIELANPGAAGYDRNGLEPAASCTV